MCPWWALGRGCPSILTPAPGSGGQKLPYLEASSAEQVRGSWLLTQGLGNLGVQQGQHGGRHNSWGDKMAAIWRGLGGTGYVTNWRAFLCPSFPELSFEGF